MRKFFENKPRAWFTIGALLVLTISLIGIGAGYFYKDKMVSNDPEVVAVVGSEKIYREELNEFTFGLTMGGSLEEPDMTDYPGVTEEQLVNMLAESKILEKEAKSLNIKVEEQELEEYINNLFPWMTEDNTLLAYVKKYQGYQLLKEKVNSRVMGSKEGYWIIARSDVYLPGAGDEMTDEQRTKTEESKIYSEKFIKEIYEDLKSGKISPEEAVEKENNDPFIGSNVPAENISLHSMAFDKTTYEYHDGPFSSKEILEPSLALKDGEFTEPIHLVTEEGVDVGWYIIYVTKSYADGLGNTYEQWLNEKHKQYGVVIYKENLK